VGLVEQDAGDGTGIGHHMTVSAAPDAVDAAA
jgi:hypothetical protein